MLVRFDDQAVVTAQAWTHTLAAYGAKDVGAVEGMPALHKVIIGESVRMEDAIAGISAIQGVRYAEPNYIYSIKSTLEAEPADKFFKDQWALKNTGRGFAFGQESLPGLKGFDIKMEEAWAAAGGAGRAANIRVAVIDTGIDHVHSDLSDNVWRNPAENGPWTPANDEERSNAGLACRDKSCNKIDEDGNGYVDDYIGWDFTTSGKGNNYPRDLNGHGTHVAGIIGSLHNGKGTVGINSKVKLMSVRVLNKEGSGTLEGVIGGILYAAKMKADIINASWGGSGESGALNEAVQAAIKSGVLFVGAAGNSAQNNDYTDNWPANFDGVLSVAASDPTGKLAFFSNTGKRKVHIVAPGHVIYSTYLQGEHGGYVKMSGTSMAAPQVAGVAALVLGVDPSLRGNQAALFKRIVDTSDIQMKFVNRVTGNGHLNAYNAVKNIVPAGHQRPDASQRFGAIRLSPLASEHPYANSITEEQVLSKSGAKWIRVKFGRYSMENNRDFIAIYDAQGNLYDMLTGLGRDTYSAPVKGDTVRLVFQTDSTVRGWGFEIQGYETIE